MSAKRQPKKIPLVFFRTSAGSEPVPEWLRELSRVERHAIGTARVLICTYRERLVALHGFIKKTRATPEEDLELARKRKKELER